MKSNECGFKDIRIVDNFYQTSSFFPMPTLLAGTLCDDGSTSLGSYSLCFPYYIAGKDYYAMVLETRNSSNTAQNLLKRGRCSLNFIPHKHRYLKEAVRLGFPGDTPQEKMKSCLFTLEEGVMAGEHPAEVFPKIVAEAFQVFECTWMRELDGAAKDLPAEGEYEPPYHDFNGITSRYGAHFILRVDKILLKPAQHEGILRGVSKRSFPAVPVDYGYRDNTHFWISPFKDPMKLPIPKSKGSDVSSVQYAADRTDPQIKFTPEACAMLVNVPRVFLGAALRGCADWARERGITLIEAKHMETIRDKRAPEKGR
jgi:hypothetical protein